MAGLNGTHCLHLHHSPQVRKYHKTPDYVIEERIRLLKNKIADLVPDPVTAMKYYAEIGRLLSQYNGEGYPANAKQIISSIYSRAKAEFEKSNGKAKLTKKIPE